MKIILSLCTILLQAEDEQLDILDDALFLLSREDDDNTLNRKVEQRTEDQMLVEKFLDNILPGEVKGGNSKFKD